MAGLSHLKAELPVSSPICRDCLVGRCRLQRQTLFFWAELDMIMVPGFPAWVCDLCGWRRFDPEARRWLRALLYPPIGPGRSKPVVLPQEDFPGGERFRDYSGRGEG